MDLAQELVDYIVDFLHDDPTTLLRVSLVSKAWAGRTRIHLFESLKIDESKFVSSNPSYLTPLCGYVKTLHLTWPRGAADPSPILDCFEQPKPRTLAIHSCELYTLSEWTIRLPFAKFPRASITALELHDIYPTHGTLLTLLSLFPNVDDLTISVSEWGDEPDNEEIIQRIFPPRFRGSFKSFDLPHRGPRGLHRGKCLSTIAALPLQFQTVSLSIGERSWEEMSWEEIWTFLNSCSKTVKKAFLVLPYWDRHQGDWPNRLSFAHLEELRIHQLTDDPPPHNLRTLLQLVTSPCLQRVIVEVNEDDVRVTFGRYQWGPLDENLVDLVERHKGYGNMTLQISTTADPEVVRGFLPRVAQEGVLEVRFSERPDYCTH